MPTSASRWRNWGLPLLAVLAGVTMLREGVSLPLVAQYSGLGAGFVVALVGAALILLAIVLAVQVLRGKDFEPEAAEGVDLRAPVSLLGLGLAATGVAMPVLTIPWLGFPVGAALAYTCVTVAFGSRNLLRDLLIGLLLTGTTWFIFTRLGVQLGPLFPWKGR